MTDKPKSQWAIEFGRLLQDRRRELGYSQQEVADMAGIHRTLLSDYERDSAPERIPTDDTLRGLSKALDVPAELMYEWAGVRYPQVGVHLSAGTPSDLMKAVLELRDQFAAGLADLSDRLERLEAAKKPQGRRPSGSTSRGRQGR